MACGAQTVAKRSRHSLRQSKLSNVQATKVPTTDMIGLPILGTAPDFVGLTEVKSEHKRLRTRPVVRNDNESETKQIQSGE